MELILKKTVETLGEEGDIVKVKSGYARNYLIPKKLAVVADKANTLYSGSGGLGNDHFLCYIPEIHGKDIKPIILDYDQTQESRDLATDQPDRTGAMRRQLETWLLSVVRSLKS